jgi:hypothetical protein
MTKVPNDPETLSEVWFAADAVGGIGVFTMDDCLRQFTVDELKAYQRADRYLEKLQPSSTCRTEPNISRFRRGMYEQFPNSAKMESLGLHAVECYCQAYAERGLYCFSSIFVKGERRRSRYYRACVPTQPVTADTFEPGIQAIICRLRFNLCFADVHVLDVISDRQRPDVEA